MLVALAFSAFLLCRFLDVPAQTNTALQQQDSQQSLQYAFPFIGSPLSNSNIDPISEREDVRVKIISAMLRGLCVAVVDKYRYVPENRTPLRRQPPIWLLKCAMLC
jgi:hypothetical protein